jgi:hypothetical protein
LIRESHSRQRLIAHALFACTLFVCFALYIAPPDRISFWPTCPIHQFLGIECPGCGATRALAALLHGRLHEALHLNALFVLLMPAAIAVAIQGYRRALRPESFRWPQPSRFAVYATIVASVAFTIARNTIQ